MKIALKRIVQLAAALMLIPAAAVVWKREEMMHQMAVNSLFDQDRIVQNFSYTDQLFGTLPLSRGGGPVLPLPAGPEDTLQPEVAAWVKTRSGTALMIPKDGQVGAGLAVRHRSGRGKIASFDDPVTKYAPRLKGSAYDAAALRRVPNMPAGVKFNEGYLDF